MFARNHSQWWYKKDALDKELFAQLLKSLPSPEMMLKGVPYSSNERINYSCTNVAYNPAFTPLWREVFQAHLSQAFLDDVLRLFGPYIPKYFPDFETRYKPISQLKAGIRVADQVSDADVLLDIQLALNTPVVVPGTTVRGPHVDCPKKLFVGLFYCRLDGDDSEGGDLEIYKPKHRPVALDQTRTGKFQDMELVESIPYEQNVLALFLNTPDSLHGVSVRSRTPLYRVFLNILGEMRTPMFDLGNGSSASSNPKFSQATNGAAANFFAGYNY
jgi:hypothetical protein